MNATALVDGGKSGETVVIGGVAFAGDIELFRYSEAAGLGKNIDAEFRSVIRCLELAIDHGLAEIAVLTDSKQVVDALGTRAAAVEELLARLERQAGNAHGMFKALQCITGARCVPFTLPAWRLWFTDNRALLAVRNVSGKSAAYVAEIDRLSQRVSVKVMLAQAGATAVAHALCERAKRRINGR